MKKTLALIAAILVICSLFAACDSANSGIVGTWTLTEDGATIEYTFNEDGTGDISAMAGMLKVEFAYSIKSGKLTFHELGNEVMGTEPYGCSISGDKLTLTLKGDSMVLERKK